MTNPTINQTITTGNTPGAPGGLPVPVQGDVMTVQANPQTEYVAAGGFAFYSNYLRSLTWAFDDITQDFGDDTYEMMQRDGVVLAAVNTMKASILEDGARFTPALDDEDADGYGKAVEIHEATEAMMGNLTPAIDDSLWNMLDGIALGNKVAEIIWCQDCTHTGKQELWVSGVKPKPRRSVAFVVDVYNNVVGLLARIPGVGTPVQAGTYLLSGGDNQYNILPREKFAVFTFRAVDGDPRGTSILRPAYNPWWLKRQTWPEYLKYLMQFASPSLVGTTAENADTYTTDGSTQTPAQIMLAQLTKMRNGAAGVFPFGAKVEPLSVSGDGAAFLNAFNLYDRQITTAILHQTRATMEAQHGSKADSETATDVLNTIVRQAKKSVERMIRNDVLKPWVRYTYGDEAVALTPYVTLGNVEQQDFSAMATAISSLTTSGYLDPSQFPGLDEALNLPVRVVSEQPEEDDNGGSNTGRLSDQGDDRGDQEDELERTTTDSNTKSTGDDRGRDEQAQGGDGRNSKKTNDNSRRSNNRASTHKPVDKRQR